MNKKTSLVIIFITVFIDLLGFGLLIPILPTFASKVLFISDFEIGILVAAFSLMQFIFNPIVGNYSDKIGRRPIILASLLVTAISYLIFSFATTFFILLISRIIAGLGGSNISAAQAYIADVTEAKDRTKGMGIIGTAFALGFVFGPMLGGFLSEYGYEVVGYVAAGFSFLAFIFAVFFLKESLVKRNLVEEKRSRLFSLNTFSELFTKKRLAFFVIVYFIIVFSMANIYGTFALLGFKVYALTDKQIGFLYTIMGLSSALVQSSILRFLLKYFNDEKLLLISMVFMIVGIGGLPFAFNFIGVAIISAISSIGTGSLQPIILGLISKEINSENQGKILGLNHSLAAMARVLGPIWGGFAYEYLGYEFPFLTGAVFTFITLLISIYFLKSKKYQVYSNV
ncbi:MAG: MFS transporter [Ignavibacteriae bacterium]|nr:MFS transporter [Ignavibacteriota bacterium]